MMVTDVEMKYLDQIVDIAYSNYLRECDYNDLMEGLEKEDLKSCLKTPVENGQGVVYIDGDKVLGYLIYSADWDTPKTMNYYFPFWGYGALGEKREKIISMVFENLAAKICKDKAVHFQIKVYAHDREIIQLFSFLQFGTQCEEGIRSTSEKIQGNDKISVGELSKEDITMRWDEIWVLLKKLIEHLKKSPVFYPGTEFTEEVYKEFFLDPSVRLFVAEADDKIIGLIAASKDGNSFLTDGNDCFNTGEIYVDEKYRGLNVAQSLLGYVNDTLKKEGIKRLWVEHGTANPNARGFWNKYFKAYTYSMIRDIEPF